jgi:hypothetical protein
VTDLSNQGDLDATTAGIVGFFESFDDIGQSERLDVAQGTFGRARW